MLQVLVDKLRLDELSLDWWFSLYNPIHHVINQLWLVKGPLLYFFFQPTLNIYRILLFLILRILSIVYILMDRLWTIFQFLQRNCLVELINFLPGLYLCLPYFLIIIYIFMLTFRPNYSIDWRQFPWMLKLWTKL